MTRDEKFQAQDDAYILSRYQEIKSDEKRLARATKVAEEQAKRMEQELKAMKNVANMKRFKQSKKK